MIRPEALVPQAAAVVRVGSQIVLVRNRANTRWVLPKGHLEPTDIDEGSRALTEAWEEAGARGVVGVFLGHYHYRKLNGLYRVAVFLVEETVLADDWPEKDFRERRLVGLVEGSELVDEPELRGLLASLEREWDG